MSEPTPPTTPPADPASAPDRRSVLLWLAGGAGVAAAGVVGAPLIGYLAGVLGHRPVTWVPVGKTSDFALNQTQMATVENPDRKPGDGASGKAGAYVRYLGVDAAGAHQFWVFAMNCTHLGCPVTWFPQSGLFMCPCHGGVYYENGDRAAGPPPQGLYKMPWRVTDGVLEVQYPHLPTLQDTLEKPAKLVQLGIIRRNRSEEA